MKKYIFNSLIAFVGGLFGVGILFILYYLISHILYTTYFKDPFPPTFLGLFLHHLIYASLIEEGIKFLLIKRNIGQYPYGFLLGLGFGIGENIVRNISFILVGPIFLHTITAGIICYFIKKNKPVLGLLIAILFHTGFNLFVIK